MKSCMTENREVMALVKHSGGKVGKAGKTLATKASSKSKKSQAGKTLAKHKSEKH